MHYSNGICRCSRPCGPTWEGTASPSSATAWRHVKLRCAEELCDRRGRHCCPPAASRNAGPVLHRTKDLPHKRDALRIQYCIVVSPVSPATRPRSWLFGGHLPAVAWPPTPSCARRQLDMAASTEAGLTSRLLLSHSARERKQQCFAKCTSGPVHATQCGDLRKSAGKKIQCSV